MEKDRRAYEAEVDKFLWVSLYKEKHNCSEDDATHVFTDKWGVDFDADAVHTDLRDEYAAYIAQDAKSAFSFLGSHPQMEGVHGEWRRMQQGYEPISSYDLDSELEVSRYLSKYDPDLCISDMTTLFPEEIHNINAESFADVCRRYNREYFQTAGRYDTGNDVVNEMFEQYDDEAYDAALKRLETLSEELELDDGSEPDDYEWDNNEVPF